LESKSKIELIKTEKIDSLYFSNNKSDEFYADFGSWVSCPIYFKLKDGNYGIGSLEQFVNPEYVDINKYYINYQDLQSVKGFQDRMFRFKLEKTTCLCIIQSKKIQIHYT